MAASRCHEQFHGFIDRSPVATSQRDWHRFQEQLNSKTRMGAVKEPLASRIANSKGRSLHVISWWGSGSAGIVDCCVQPRSPDRYFTDSCWNINALKSTIGTSSSASSRIATEGRCLWIWQHGYFSDYLSIDRKELNSGITRLRWRTVSKGDTVNWSHNVLWHWKHCLPFLVRYTACLALEIAVQEDKQSKLRLFEIYLKAIKFYIGSRQLQTTKLTFRARLAHRCKQTTGTYCRGSSLSPSICNSSSKVNFRTANILAPRQMNYVKMNSSPTSSLNASAWYLSGNLQLT